MLPKQASERGRTRQYSIEKSKPIESITPLKKAIKLVGSTRVTPEILSQIENQAYKIDEMNLNLVNYM